MPLSDFLGGAKPVTGGMSQALQPKLPYGALGFTPKGEPYYGPGFGGMVRKFFSRFTDPELFKHPDLPSNYAPGMDVSSLAPQEQRAVAAQEDVDAFADNAWKTWQQFTASFGIGEPKGDPRGTASGSFEGDFKNLVKSYAAKIRSPISVGFGSGVKQMGNALWDSLIPVLSLGEVPFRKGFAASLALNEIAPPENFIEAVTGLNKVSFVFDKLQKGETSLTLQERKTIDKYTRGSNMVYTMLVDEMARKEYLRRYGTGENPDFIVEDLANAWVELGGSLVFDVFNAIPGGAGGKAGRIANAADEFLKPSARILKEVDKLKPLVSAVDEIKLASKFDDGIEVIHKAGILGSLDKMLRAASDYRLLSGTASTKIGFYARRVNTLMREILRGGGDVGEIVADMLRAGSKNPDTYRLGISNLLSSKYGNMFMSEAGLDTISLLSKLSDEFGDSAKLLDKIKEFKGADEAVEFFSKSMDNVLKGIFPSIDEMAQASQKAAKLGDKADAATKALAKAYESVKQSHKLAVWSAKAEKALGKVYKIPNTFFAYAYFGLNPGYVFRNVMSDSMAMAFDLGPGFAAENIVKQIADGFLATARKLGAKEIKLFCEKELDDIATMMGRKADDWVLRGKGFHNAADILSGKMGSRLAMGAAETTELRESIRIARRVLRRELRNSIRSGMLPDVKRLEAFGVDADTFGRLLLDNYGDPKKTVDAYMQLVGDGVSKLHLNVQMSPEMGKWLDHFGLDLPKPEDFGDDTEKWREVFTDTLAEIRKNVDLKGTKNIIPVDEDVSRMLDGLDEAIKGGSSFESAVLHGRIQAMKNSNRVARNLVAKELEKLSKEGYNTIPFYARRDKFVESLDSFVDEQTSFQYLVTKEIRNALYKLPDDAGDDAIRALWKQVLAPALGKSKMELKDGILSGGETILQRVGLGDLPPGITPRQAMGKIWDFYFAKRDEFWAAFGEDTAQNAVDLLRQVVDELGIPPERAQQILHGDEMKKLLVARQNAGLWNSIESVSDIPNKLPEIVKKFFAHIPDDTPLSKAPINWDMLQDLGAPHRMHVKNGVAKEVRESLDAEYKVLREKLTNAKGDELDAIRKRMGEIDETVRPSDPTVGQAREYVLKNLVASNPIPEEVPPLMSDVIKKQLPGLWDDAEKYADEVVSLWGKTKKVVTDKRTIDAMKEWAAKASDQLVPIRTRASAIAQHERDFILHSYSDKTYFDQALAFGMPWHYWYSRSYPKYLKRMVETPQVLTAYVKYRKALEQEHAGMPDWWKYNISTDDLGIDLDNPLYFNIESTLNPMYGLTGVDFYDQTKRATWYSRAVDDMTKFGPSLWTPLNWMVAGALHLQGEEEASKRWMGRLIPATATVKALMYKMGVKMPIGNYNDLDPFSNIFYGGLDPYERRRIGRMMGKMVDDGSITPEQAQEAMYLQSGELWEKAVAETMKFFAPGQISSFFFGTGFKSRTTTDIQVDNFYQDYYALIDNKSNLSPEQYSDTLVQLRTKYPWMDTVLLSRQNVEDRDTSYAYSVLSRIAPGQKTELAELAGISADLLAEFYDNKGDLTKMTDQDADRFRAGVADLGALLAIPDDSTQREWISASTTYKTMKADMTAQFGEDISELIDSFYQLENQQERDKFMSLHPEVRQAMDYQTQMIVSNPMLYKYYGGISKLESYYRTQMYDILKEKYGEDIQKVVDEYYSLKVTDPAQAKYFYRTHPQISAYFEMKGALQDKINRIVVQLGSKLPERPQIKTREDFEPTGATQTTLAEGVPQAPTWEEWQTRLEEPVQRVILDYFQNGSVMSKAVKDELDYLAGLYGYKSGDAMLQAIGISLSR